MWAPTLRIRLASWSRWGTSRCRSHFCPWRSNVSCLNPPARPIGASENPRALQQFGAWNVTITGRNELARRTHLIDALPIGPRRRVGRHLTLVDELRPERTQIHLRFEDLANVIALALERYRLGKRGGKNLRRIAMLDAAKK